MIAPPKDTLQGHPLERGAPVAPQRRHQSIKFLQAISTAPRPFRLTVSELPASYSSSMV
jgi:hypothetical protein